MPEWKPIDTAPADDDRPGGRYCFKARDRSGTERFVSRGLFNNSGWHERGTNREFWPVEWFDDGSHLLPYGE